MNEMVERVALALHEKNCDDDVDVKEDFYSQPDWWQRIAFDHAKAAIQAMREPSAAMIQAGLDDQAYVDSTLHSTWRSMIAEASGDRHREVAALEEEK